MVVAFAPGLTVSAQPGFAPGSFPGFDGGGFLPNVLSTLQLWLDGADTSATNIVESSDLVSQWADKSGNGNNVTQGTGSLQPLTNSSTLNGKNGLLFDTLDLMVTSSFTFSDQGYTTFVVSRLNTALSAGANFPRSLRTDSDSQSLFYRKTNGRYEIKSLNTGADDPRPFFEYEDDFPTNTASIITSCVELDNVSIRGNGVSKASSARSATASSLTVDTFIEVASDYKGDMFEIIVYGRVLTATEITSVESYLSNKWGT